MVRLCIALHPPTYTYIARTLTVRAATMCGLSSHECDNGRHSLHCTQHTHIPGSQLSQTRHAKPTSTPTSKRIGVSDKSMLAPATGLFDRRTEGVMQLRCG